MIVFTAITLLLAIVMVLGFVAIAGTAEGVEILIATILITALIGSAIQLSAAIVGIKAANGTGKVKTAFVFGIIILAFAVYSIISSIMGGNFAWTNLVSIALSGAYFYGAYALKKEVETAQQNPTSAQ